MPAVRHVVVLMVSLRTFALVFALAFGAWLLLDGEPSATFAQATHTAMPALRTPSPEPSPIVACGDSPVKPPPVAPAPLMAVAPDGTLYLMELSQTIFRFHPGANGDAAPDGRFCLPYHPYEPPVTLAATGEEVFVAAAGSVSVLPANASGPVAPSRTLGDPHANPSSTSLFSNMGPYAVSVGRDGSIYVLSDKSCHCSAGGTGDAIDIYAPGASGNSGSTARGFFPVSYAVTQGGKKSVVDFYVQSMGLDDRSRLFLVSDGSLVVSRPGARAPFALEAKLRLFDEPVDRQLAFDDAGTAYIAQGPNIVVVTGATGANPHVTKLAGPKTRITDAESIATDASGKLYVENCAGADTSIFVFPAGARGNISPLYELRGRRIALSCPVTR